MALSKIMVLLVILGVSMAAVPIAKKTEMPDGLVEGCVIDCSASFRRHPSDCRKYIQCAPTGPQEMPCPPGTLWDQKLRTCNHDSAITCDVGFYLTPEGTRCPGSCPLTCPSNKVGKYPHPRDCTKYFSCNKGVASYRTCIAGLFFDSETKLCTEASLATCTATPDAEC